MLPPKCITCGKLLADIEIEYKETKQMYQNDEKLSEEEVAKLVSQLLDKLHIKRMCCRSQVLTFVDLVKIII